MQHMTHGNFVGTSWRVFCNAATIRTHQEIVTLVYGFFLSFVELAHQRKGEREKKVYMDKTGCKS